MLQSVFVRGVMDERAAVDRARELAGRPGPSILGIAGPPGSGKSTLADRIAAHVPGAVLVGMDGFHLAHATLERLGRVERKGAPDTFDAGGYVALLRRIRGLSVEGGHEGTIWAPHFQREIEDAVAGAVPVTAEATLVVTEGNYLLLEDPPWGEVRQLLDECWYVDLGDGARRARLQERHERYGRSPDEARARTWGSDERNAVVVAASRHRADAIVVPAASLD